MMQHYNKILIERNAKWKIPQKHVPHRFQSRTFTYSDILKYYVLIHAVCYQHEQRKRIVSTYRDNWYSYQNRLQDYNKPKKDQATKPILKEQLQNEANTLLFGTKEPVPPEKPTFVRLYRFIDDASNPLRLALLLDHMNVFKTLGQSIASKNKVFCTEIHFVDKAEDAIDQFSLQNFQSPISKECKLTVSKYGTKQVECFCSNINGFVVLPKTNFALDKSLFI